MSQEIEVDVFIVSKNKHIKYKYDFGLKAPVCEKILHIPIKYDFNYGFIPNTLTKHGYALNVVVLMEDELISGCFIKCKFLGVLETEDNYGEDPKIIMVPCKKVDPKYDNLNEISDLTESTKEKIKYFFTNYYQNSENGQVKIGNWLDKESALSIYLQSLYNINNHD